MLDEPTSGLDPLLQEGFSRLVQVCAADGATVFLSSHDLDEVQRPVTRLAIIGEGRIVAVDTVDGLRQRAPRVIGLRLDRARRADAFTDLPGVTVTVRTPRHLKLAVTGPISGVLREAALLDVSDITARPADLEELFRRFYAPGTEAAPDAH